MDQRRQIDIGHAVGDQFDEAPIDAAILRLLLVDQSPSVMNKASTAGGKRQQPGIGLDADVPGLRTGLAPVELRPDRQAGVVAETEIGRDGSGAILGERTIPDPVRKNGRGRISV